MPRGFLRHEPLLVCRIGLLAITEGDLRWDNEIRKGDNVSLFFCAAHWLFALERGGGDGHRLRHD